MINLSLALCLEDVNGANGQPSNGQTKLIVNCRRCRDRAMVRALVSHCCGPGRARVRFPDPVSHVGWVCCWFRGFFSGFSGFLPSTKTNTPNSNSIRKWGPQVCQFSSCPWLSNKQAIISRQMSQISLSSTKHWLKGALSRYFATLWKARRCLLINWIPKLMI